MKRFSLVVFALLFGVGVSTLACGSSAPASDADAPAVTEAVAPEAPAPAAAQGESLYDRLGGIYSIAAVADDIIERVLANETIEANPLVRAAHARLPKAGLKYQVASLICNVTGGPCTYVGRDMKTTHAGLNISEAEWEALMGVFGASFDAFEVPQQEQDELFAIIAGTKADIVVAP